MAPRRPKMVFCSTQNRPQRATQSHREPQRATKTLQDAPRRLPEASKRPRSPSRRLQGRHKRLPDASKTLKLHSKTAKTSPRGLHMPPRRPISLPRSSKVLVSCPKILLPCEVHAKSLPISKVCQGCLSPEAKHDGSLSNSWPFTKDGLAVVRPRRASSIRQNTLVLQWRV